MHILTRYSAFHISMYQLTIHHMSCSLGAETMYLLKELNKKSAGETIVVGGDGLDLDEMRKFTKIGTEGMVKYLALVPPEELDAAMSKFNAKR